eukprot:TRINITY_DN5654_c0_g3_i1.p1 TRINITY_DN5654_c0_g3~~TRINITY_DN5654_c0_g3_i1.p1  ORF type:complete len:291 (+),score=6.31 TRINITY_DN5654_c0_g3_i1:88-960(+)
MLQRAQAVSGAVTAPSSSTAPVIDAVGGVRRPAAVLSKGLRREDTSVLRASPRGRRSSGSRCRTPGGLRCCPPPPQHPPEHHGKRTAALDLSETLAMLVPTQYVAFGFVVFEAVPVTLARYGGKLHGKGKDDGSSTAPSPPAVAAVAGQPAGQCMQRGRSRYAARALGRRHGMLRERRIASRELKDSLARGFRRITLQAPGVPTAGGPSPRGPTASPPGAAGDTRRSDKAARWGTRRAESGGRRCGGLISAPRSADLLLPQRPGGSGGRAAGRLAAPGPAAAALCAAGAL